jgi:hypothetical protein
MADPSSCVVRTVKFGVVAASLLIIGLSILSRPEWKLRDFDQVFYVTIAYDQTLHTFKDQLEPWNVLCGGDNGPPRRGIVPKVRRRDDSTNTFDSD